MLVIDDALDAILLGCLLFGLLFAALSMVFGGADAALGDGSAAGDGDGGGLINLSSVLAFVAWLGGVGYLARHGLGWPGPAAIGAGVAGGLVGGAAVVWFLAKVVRPNDRALDPADYRLPGTVARVTSSIFAGGTGEVVYEQAGVRQVAAARAANGRAIPRGVEVVVLEADRGVVIVEPAEEFFEGDPVLTAVRPNPPDATLW